MPHEQFAADLRGKLEALPPAAQVREFLAILAEGIRDVFADGKLNADDYGPIADAAETIFDIVSAYDMPKVPNFIERPVETMIRGSIRPSIKLFFSRLFETD